MNIKILKIITLLKSIYELSNGDGSFDRSHNSSKQYHINVQRGISKISLGGYSSSFIMYSNNTSQLDVSILNIRRLSYIPSTKDAVINGVVLKDIDSSIQFQIEVGVSGIFPFYMSQFMDCVNNDYKLRFCLSDLDSIGGIRFTDLTSIITVLINLERELINESK